MIRVDLTEADTDRLGEELEEELKPRMERAAKAGAQVWWRKIREILSRASGSGTVYGGPGSVRFAARARQERGVVFSRKGRTVRVKEFGATRRGRVHQAAAEGEPPTRVTGELLGSIVIGPLKWLKREVRVPVGSPLPWAGRMEFGGRDRKGRRLPPHPYMRPAAEMARHEIEAAIEREL